MLDGIHLTLLIGPLIPVPAPTSVVEALISAEVTASGTQRSGFQLTFAAGPRSPLTTTLLPAGYLDPGIRVIIIATVGGVPNVLMDGIINRQDLAPSNDVGGSTVTVTGEDISVLMDLIDLSGMKYPAMPDVAIADVIMLKYAAFGILPLAVPSPLIDVPVPTSRIPTQEGTDLAFLRKLASDAGYVFYVDPGPAPGTSIGYWGPSIRVGVPQSALNVGFDGATNVESISFSYDGLTPELPVMVIQEPTTKVPIPIPVPNVSLLKPPLAVRPAIPRRVRIESEGAKLSPVRAALLALARAGNSADAVTGSGRLDVLRYGRVLKPRGLVGVRGAGMAYDGLYYVSSVTHSIKPGEYKQSFQLSREGLISLTPRVVA